MAELPRHRIQQYSHEIPSNHPSTSMKDMQSMISFKPASKPQKKPDPNRPKHTRTRNSASADFKIPNYTSSVTKSTELDTPSQSSSDPSRNTREPLHPMNPELEIQVPESDSDFFSSSELSRPPHNAIGLENMFSFPSPRIQSRFHVPSINSGPSRPARLSIDIPDSPLFPSTSERMLLDTPLSANSSLPPETPNSSAFMYTLESVFPLAASPSFDIADDPEPIVRSKKRALPMTDIQKVRKVLGLISELRLTLSDFFCLVLTSKNDTLLPHSNVFFRSSSNGVHSVLNCIDSNAKGHEALEAWYTVDRARTVICQRISEQMEAAKSHFRAKHKTTFYPLRVTTQEEKTIQGNLRIHEDVYISQLKCDPSDPELSKYLIPSINDQFTNSRIRSCVIHCFGDTSSWSRQEIFAIGIAVFHMVMNLVWAIQAKHYGNAKVPGSLAFFFHIMQKKRLAGDKPDYRALSTALFQILDAILISAWRKECGDLDLLASENPTAQKLKSVANQILSKYITPLSAPRERESIHPKKASSKSNPMPVHPPPSEMVTPHDPTNDPAHQNLRLLARDLLVLTELIDAIPTGDFGRIENLLPDLAAIFRGAGSVKYATEIMHLLHNFNSIH
ncbi:hypothetical protein VKT23_012934 [Stygiomarasmius scandens]|uniref:DUF6589 domain-containing protein n=1 Tax=Marasmiellus scandens TaxID=2682957 RepID=A0ABR1J9F6_9AGAR